MKLPIVGILSGFALATLGISGVAQAAILLPSLTPGSQYRLVFVTSSTRSATATNILDYNIFVNNAAHASTALNTALTTAGFTPSAINWTAIASTATTSAIVNTATQATDTSRPIYGLDGTQVALSYSDLWTLGAEISLDETGNSTFPNVSSVWSGTLEDGSTGIGLGSVFPLVSNYGIAPYFEWINTQVGMPPSSNADLLRLYGISDPLTVPTPAAATPEPSSLFGFIALGGLMLGGAVRKAKK